MGRKTNEPWMPLFYDSWLLGTTDLSDGAYRVYLEMCILYWRNGGRIVDDCDQVATMLLQTRRKVVTNWSQVRNKFVAEDGYLYHERLEEELFYSSEKSRKSRDAANKRWENDEKKHRASAMPNRQTDRQTYNIYVQNAEKWDFLKEEFWKLFPKKEKKKDTFDLIDRKAKKGEYSIEEFSSIIERLKLHIDNNWKNTERQFIPNPHRYLNKELFNDEISQDTRRTSSRQHTTSYEQSEAALDDWERNQLGSSNPEN